VAGQHESLAFSAGLFVHLHGTVLLVPEAGIFKASSYDPHWTGQVVQVRGTLSHVDLDMGKFPPYATIHFKETNGDRLTVFTPNSDMWQDSFGETFAGLIGKPIEVYGQIDEWREGAGVRVLTSDQLKVIDAVALANIHESHPAWLTAPIPTQVLADTPEYVGWRKYSPGTKVGLEYRLVPLELSFVAHARSGAARRGCRRSTDCSLAWRSLVIIAELGPEPRLQFTRASVAMTTSKALPEAKAQHYVSRFYLQGFTDKQGSLWVCEKFKPIRKSTPKHEAHLPDYYTHAEPGERDETAEHTLEGIESRAASVIRKLANFEFNRSAEQMGHVYLFVAFMFARVPSWREHLDKLFGKVVRETELARARDKEKFHKLCADMERDTGKSLNMDFEELRQYPSSVGRSYSTDAMTRQ
jgi:hypothetical protein